MTALIRQRFALPPSPPAHVGCFRYAPPRVPISGKPEIGGRRERSRGQLSNQSPPPKPVVFFPRPARPRGLSRGIVRPGGRAVSVLNSRRGLEWRRGRAGRSQVLPDLKARRGSLKRTARGVRIAASQPLRHFDIDIRHGGESCRIRTPRTSWDRARLQPRGGSRRGRANAPCPRGHRASPCWECGTRLDTAGRDRRSRT